jgi:hypothetical protein
MLRLERYEVMLLVDKFAREHHIAASFVRPREQFLSDEQYSYDEKPREERICSGASSNPCVPTYYRQVGPGISSV